MARTLHALKRKPQHPAELKLERIRGIIDAVERRCLAADRAAWKFQDEVTASELQSIYRLAGGKVGR